MEIQSPYTPEQLTTWMRGLLAIAWADGHFDPEEKDIIKSLTHEQIQQDAETAAPTPIGAAELAKGLGDDPDTAENFLRTAVMVAVADGAYSDAEDQVLHQFCQALNLPDSLLDSLRAAMYHPERFTNGHDHGHGLNVLHPLQQWLDEMQIHDPKLAHFLCKLIPSQCPFERDVNLFGRTIAHIPPLCKLNPIYEQLVGLRFRALSYLADECGEDVTPYC